MDKLSSGFKEIDINQAKASHVVKFGLLCVNKKSVPSLVGYLCFLISQLQALAMILKSSDLFLKDDTQSIPSVAKLFYKLFTVNDVIAFGESSLTTSCAFITGYILGILLLFSYLHVKIRFRQPIPKSLQSCWSYLCYLHPLVLFFPIHNVCLESLRYVSQEEEIGTTRAIFISLFIFNIIINWTIVFIPVKAFYSILKTADPLSSKNNLLASKDLVIKTIIPIIWIFASDIQWFQIIVMLADFCDKTFYNWALFYYLPYYRIKTLEIASILCALQTTLSFLALFVKLINFMGLYIGISFLQITFILLAPIGMWISYSYLWKVLVKIISLDCSEINIYYLLHKRYILKYMIKKRIQYQFEQRKFNWFHYLYVGKLSRMAEVLKLSFSELEGNTKTMLNNMINFLIWITKNYPKSNLTKVNLAYYYVKYQNSYLLANNIIEEILSQNPSLSVHISLVLIRLELQRNLYLEYSHQGKSDDQSQGLNIFKYITVHEISDKLKNEISLQVKLQLDFWKNFLCQNPDMSHLMKISSKINHKKKTIQKIWSELCGIRHPTFLSPLLMYGMYISIANNDSITGEKFMEQYHAETKKIARFINPNKLDNNTVFCEDTVQITMSGLKTKLGKILDCSANISQVFGWERNFAKGRSVTFLMSPFFRETHDGILRKHYNTGQSKLLNKTVSQTILAKDGFICSIWLHVKMNPLVEVGISYIGVIRPIRSTRRILLVRQDGSIDGMSKTFAKDMNIVNNYNEFLTKLFILCPEFKVVNEAFNIIAFKTIQKNDQDHFTENANPETARNSKNNNDTVVMTDRTYEPPKTTERYLLKRKENDSKPKAKHNFSVIRKSFDQNSFRFLSNRSTDPLMQIFDSDSRALAIYEHFTTGANLAFYPQRSYLVDGNNIKLFRGAEEGPSQPIIYKVEIKNIIYGQDFIKMLSLDKVSGFNPDLADSSERLNTFLSSHSNSAQNEEQIRRLSEKDEPLSAYFKSHSAIEPPSWKPPTRDQIQFEFGNSTRENHYVIELGQKEKDPIEAKRNYNESLSIIDELKSQDTGRREMVTRSFFHERELPIRFNELNLQNAFFYQKLVPKTPNFAERSPRKAKIMTSDDNPDPWFQPLQKNVSAPAKKIRSKNFSEGEDVKIRAASSGNFKSTIPFPEQEPLQEDGLLRKKLKGLKEKLNQPLNRQNGERSIASSYLSRGKKIQSLVTQALGIEKRRKSGKLFSYSYICYILIIVGALLTQLTLSLKILDNIADKSCIINLGFIRLDSLISLNLETRMFYQLLKGKYSIVNWQYDNFLLKDLALNSTKTLNSYNNQLRIEISELDMDFQNKFYQKIVKVSERQTDGSLKVISTTSSFEAIQRIVDKELRFAEKPIPAAFVQDIEVDDLRFVLDNSWDDLLISSENSISILIENMNSSLIKLGYTRLISFSTVAFVSILFLGVLLKYFLSIQINSKKFMTLIFKLDIKECEQIRVFLQRFKVSLQTDIRDIDIPEENLYSLENNSLKGMAKRTTSSRKVTMNRLLKSQIFQFLKVVPFNITMVIGGTIFTIIFFSRIDELALKQTQIQESLRHLNLHTLLCAEFLELIAENSTKTIRNQPIEDNLLKDIQEAKNIAGLINKFQEKDGSLPKIQHDIFFGLSCTDLDNLAAASIEESLIAELCLNITEGKRTVSLTNLNSDFSTALVHLYNLYLTSNKTEDDLVRIFELSSVPLQKLDVLSRKMLKLLFENSDTNFQANITNMKDQNILYTICLLLFVVIYASINQFQIFKKIFKFETRDRQILKLIPVQFILGNRYLQQYLLQTSDGVLDDVKRFL